ncbi:hypothetical protein DVH26_16880 [Paenibacillus sp. H1-7]|uniref:hypothetical protein n=1 Tax=Paenibacillus sp. H1-7 TaxID=2282849 RepID=UPI001EF825DF|nr:hypothetical protein [Paenibacillus sp. H1-7]ULL15971.1 hypothetical protein DVH26_16880 [Paenibacillus sp. H1-7]
MKRILWTKLGLSAMLALAVTASCLPPMIGSAADQPELSSDSVRGTTRIVLGAEQMLEVGNTRLFRHESSSVISFEVTIRNGSSVDLPLDDYYFAVKTRSGSIMNFKVLPEDAQRKLVPAGASGTYRFYGTVANGLNADGLLIEIGRWDFGSASLSVPLGSVALSDAAPAPGGNVVDVNVNNGTLQGTIASTASRSMGKNKEITWTVTFRNAQAAPAALPDWSFWLQSSGDQVYSMTPDRKTEGLIIEPGTDMSFTLIATLPAETDTDSSPAGLVITRTLAEANNQAKVYVPASYVPIPADTGGAESGASRTFIAAEGTFTASLESLQRWPWDHRDLVTAAVTLVNVSDAAVPVPKLNGTFRADNTQEWTAQVVPTDTIRLLQPGQSTRMYMQANLDPKEIVQAWDILLQEAVDMNGKPQNVHRTEWSKQTAAPVKEVAAGQSTEMNGLGGKWAYSASAPTVYESTNGQLVTVRVDAVNLDKRYNPLDKWVTQLVTAEGAVYPAEVEVTEQRVIPQGKASLTAWTVLPKGADIQGLKLMLGLAVTGSKLSGMTDKPDSFLQAAEYLLPEKSASQPVKEGELNFYPYTLTIKDKNKPYWNYNEKRAVFEVNYSFDYTLLKDLSIVSEMKKRRVIVELLDGAGEKIHEEAYALEPEDAGTKGWDIGSGTEKWTADSKELSINTTQYTVNVYEEFLPGYKRLISSTTSDWMSR